MTFRNTFIGLFLCAALQIHAGTIKVACIGDSITAGAGSTGGQTYPVQLQALLGAGYQVTNYGVSGRTMLGPGFGDFPYVLEPNYTASSTAQPNIVIIKLGTNDSKPQNWANKVQFEADARAMVTHYATLASKPQVYLVLPCPVYNAGCCQITSPIVQDEVVPMLANVAVVTATPVIDVNTAMSNHPELFVDNVHPNNAGYALLAQTVFNAITMGKPTSANTTAISPSRIDLAWTDGATNETGFSIERKIPGGTFAVVGTAAANAASFSDTTVLPVMDYVYRVRAVNASGESPFSNESAVSTPDTVPVAPTSASAVVVSTSQIDLTWIDNASNEIGFKIERRTGASGAYAQIATVLANVTAYSDAGLSAATLYTYRVRASNSAGDSEFSNEIAITTFSGGAAPTADDSDGDGFSNALETAAGTSPLNVLDTPMGGALAGTPLALADVKVSIKLSFAATGKDSVSLAGNLVLPAAFSTALQPIVVDIGGVAQSFTLNAKNSAKSASGSVSVKDSGKGSRVAKLSVKAAKGDFAAAFADEGLVNASVEKDATVRVSVLFASAMYEGNVTLKYKAKSGKSGSAK